MFYFSLCGNSACRKQSQQPRKQVLNKPNLGNNWPLPSELRYVHLRSLTWPSDHSQRSVSEVQMQLSSQCYHKLEKCLYANFAWPQSDLSAARPKPPDSCSPPDIFCSPSETAHHVRSDSGWLHSALGWASCCVGVLSNIMLNKLKRLMGQLFTSHHALLEKSWYLGGMSLSWSDCKVTLIEYLTGAENREGCGQI